jgi:hypothetical protein
MPDVILILRLFPGSFALACERRRRDVVHAYVVGWLGWSRHVAKFPTTLEGTWDRVVDDRAVGWDRSLRSVPDGAEGVDEAV